MMESFTLEEMAQGLGGRLRGSSGDRRVLRLHTDTRTLRAGDCFVALAGDHYDGHDYVARLAPDQALAAVVSRPVDSALPLIEVPDTLVALQQFSGQYRRSLHTRIIGVTGSSGKTSTKEMIASVLRQKFRTTATQGNLNNHLGVPFTLLELMRETECGVIEMGMNHRGEIAPLAELARPDIGVITNIGNAHLEHLGTEEEIALEKTDLIAALAPSGIAVLSADDYWSVRYADRTSARIIWTGLSEKAQVRGEDIVVTPQGIRFTLISEQGRCAVHLPILNRVMVKNALLAAGVGLAMELSMAEVARGLSEVKLTGARMEVLAHRAGWIINDTYNANPQSMRAAVAALQEFPASGRKIAILGSMGELGASAEELHQEIGFWAASQVDLLVTVGPKAAAIAAGARRGGLYAGQIHACERMEEVVPLVQPQLQPTDVILVKGSRFLQLERVVEALVNNRETR
jgi:UDP-N-acetylmuramoyl-tripeptide--D-alanyl-D-alanine ligase